MDLGSSTGRPIVIGRMLSQKKRNKSSYDSGRALGTGAVDRGIEVAGEVGAGKVSTLALAIDHHSHVSFAMSFLQSTSHLWSAVGS